MSCRRHSADCRCPSRAERTGSSFEKRRWFVYRQALYWGIPLLDMYEVTANPATGSYLSGYSLNGVHPSNAGITAISSAFYPLLKNLETLIVPPYYGVYSEASNSNPANLFINGSFVNITTPPNPDYWTFITTNATVSTSAAPAPYTGKSVTYNLTAPGSVRAITGSSLTTGYSVGDTLQFNGRVIVAGLTPATASGMDAWHFDQQRLSICSPVQLLFPKQRFCVFL